MPRMYLKLLPDVYARKILARKAGGVPYSGDQFAAFIGMLCAAEAVSPRGRFPSKALLRGMLEGDDPTFDCKEAIEFLIEQGDLVQLEDGVWYVDGWDELQEGRDPNVVRRMQGYRNRRRSKGGTGTGYGSVTRNSLEVTDPMVNGEPSISKPLTTNGGVETKNDPSRARGGGLEKLSDTSAFRQVEKDRHH